MKTNLKTNLHTPGVFAALDTTDIEAAARLALAIKPHVAGLKLGLEFFLRHGHTGVDAMGKVGLPIFLDLKLHDIPNTVAGGIRAVMPLAPRLITIHASGGAAMVRAAKDAAEDAAARANVPAPAIIAVSVLTSLDNADLDAVGIPNDPPTQVLQLAGMAMRAGADGIVCSPKEIRLVRDQLGDVAAGGPIIVSPGIRPLGDGRDDQKRVMTPYDAVSAGANVLVVGRSITTAADPAAAAASIAREIAG